MSGVRRWSVGLAGGAAVAAAVIGAAGAPAARADDGSLATDIGLLNTAEADLVQVESLSGNTDTMLPGVIDQFEAIQTPLLSSDNNVFSGLGETLFNGPDQQLAQAADGWLTATQAYSADPTTANALADLSASFQVDGTLLGNQLPAEVIGKLVDRLFDLGGGDTAGTAAATAASTIVTPADLLSDAGTNYTDAGQLVSGISSTSVGDYAPALASVEEFDGQMVQGIANLDSAETALSSYDNGALAEFLSPVFTNLDQSWDSASQATLEATQALDGVAGSGSTADIGAAFLAVTTSEFEGLQPLIQAEFVDLGAHFLTGGDFTSLADLGANLDPVSAVDPSLFTDLLSSIGL